jgi:hypothetical protein
MHCWSQEDSQHRASTQWPLPHWESVVQLAPRADFFTHWDPLQVYPAAHSFAVAHRVAQASPAQANGSQGVDTASGQVPVPSHLAAAIATPKLQLAGRHERSVVASQAVTLIPSQNPAHRLEPPQAGRAPRGLPRTGRHAPASPGTSQASHWPVHSESQQTPSVQ